LRPTSDGFEIEAGHRRFCACQLLGWSEIPALVQSASVVGDQHLDRAHENFIRENLNPVEEARIVWDLVHNDGLGMERAAAMLCKTVSWIDSRCEIAKMPDDLKEAISDGRLKVAVAREIAKVKDAATRARLVASACEYGATAAVVKNWCADSRVGEFLMPAEIPADQGDIQSIPRSQVELPCRICDIRQQIDVLRHVWVCPECLGMVRELARATQHELSLSGGEA
jgi:ParB/RepB/Spo0J family partition protein